MYKEDRALEEIGVWRMDLDTGDVQQLITLVELGRIGYPGQTSEDNHGTSVISRGTDGLVERFLMFNRWAGGGQPTRVFTMAADGSDLRLLSGHGASHWTWRDSDCALIWAEGAYKLYRDDDSGETCGVLWEHVNGHQSYVPATDNAWLLTDTYPANNQQELCLYHIPSKKKVSLGVFDSPSAYRGEWRCDLHPRLSRSGTKVVIDSPHQGNGRQMYLIEIEDILAQGRA